MLVNGEIWDKIKDENNLIKGHKGSFTTANGQPLEVMGKVKTKLKIGVNQVELDVFVANDLQHECLVGLDIMGKVEGTKTKIKEMISSLKGEEVPTKISKKQSVNTVEFTDEEQKVKQEFLDKNEDMFASSMKDLEQIKKQLDELLEAGIIEPSNSEWATALVPIKKKTGGIRLCIQYRKLNQVTKKDSFPIPRLDEKTDKFYERENCDSYTIWIDKCSRYISKNGRQSFKRTNWKAALKLNRKKCFFMKRQVIYLGHVVNSDGLFPCEDKVAAIKAFKTPRTIKQLQSFLGLTGYFRKFIRDYSKIASPLFKATMKGKKFEFDKRCEDAFNKLKDCLTGIDLLILPDFHDTFGLETDASDIGLGAVLWQKRDGESKPIAYWSRQLIKSEENYSATEKRH
ncbi:unnamed protein product [Brachionus calyciflorus]|uniref:Reverse transcriptase/retrotransposon-derived protein RNase H-like domain-containing protein n=1 Tax=Brachionus calyciflorus TaxID=104777 RepID=A0A813U4G5_9BILA|nr:unnamed protein product [Brachionus calyciflorus]